MPKLLAPTPVESMTQKMRWAAPTVLAGSLLVNRI